VTIDLSAAETVQDVLNTINNAGLFVRAQINAAGDGIEVVNAVSGVVMTIGENGGTTATDLGIRSLNADTLVSSLNHGQGLRTVDSGADLRVTARDGSSFTVALRGVRTIGDVLAAINQAATDAGVAVTADLALVGNGIRLADQTGGAGSLSVSRENLSFAVDDLGLSQTVVDPVADLVGDDVNGVRVSGILSDLCDLERALRDDDSAGLSTASESLDVHLQDFNRSRGVIGARAKAMQDRLSQTEQAVSSTEALLGQVQDLDYTEAITQFQQAQLALQASLTTGAKIMSMSLLDFLA
jgi:flagellar hook-associated protein 3 FlgL